MINAVQLVEAIETRTDVYLVMELCACVVGSERLSYGHGRLSILAVNRPSCGEDHGSDNKISFGMKIFIELLAS
jgi:hypothetical protein